MIRRVILLVLNAFACGMSVHGGYTVSAAANALAVGIGLMQIPEIRAALVRPFPWARTS